MFHRFIIYDIAFINFWQFKEEILYYNDVTNQWFLDYIDVDVLDVDLDVYLVVDLYVQFHIDFDVDPDVDLAVDLNVDLVDTWYYPWCWY